MNPKGNAKSLPKRPRGRPKGSKDKIPQGLKEKILFIAEDLDKRGIGLHDQAKEEPRWFFEHFLKGLIPKDIKLEHNISDDLRAEVFKLYHANKPKS